MISRSLKMPSVNGGQLAVNEQMLEWKDEQTGEVVSIPAIDERWLDVDREYGRFELLENADSNTTVTWCSDMMYLLAGLRWLRCLSYHKFWSTVIFDDDVHDMLDSYLDKCPRYIEPAAMELHFHGVSKEVNQLMAQLHKSIMLICVRMATHKESTNLFMNIDFFANAVEANAIWTVPRIINFCSLFGRDNPKIVTKMVEKLFADLPKLRSDLEMRAEAIFAPEGIIDRAQSRAVKLSHGRHNQDMQGVVISLNQDLTQRDEIRELVNYVLELIYTLDGFCRIYPNALTIFDRFNPANRLPGFCEVVKQKLRDEIDTQVELGGFSSDKGLLLGRLEMLERETVSLVRAFVNTNLITPCCKSDENSQTLLTKYLEWITNNLEHKEFMWAFNHAHPISADMERLRSSGVNVDQSHLDYINGGLKSIDDAVCYLVVEKLRNQRLLQGLDVPTVEVSSQIAMVTDLFPELSTEFVHLCLRHFKGNVDHVIDALCSHKSKLPVDLQKCYNIAQYLSGKVAPTPEIQDYQYQIIEEENWDLEPACSSANGVAEESVHIEQQLPVPLTEGKKHGNWRAEKENKAEVAQMKQFYEHYQYETLSDDEAERLMYDDEYDDTYDAATEAPDASNVDQLLKRRRQPLPIARAFEPETSDTEQEQTEEGAAAAPRTNQAPPPRPYRGDYTGGLNRQKKERNKGKDFAHKRDKKYRGGMF